MGFWIGLLIGFAPSLVLVYIFRKQLRNQISIIRKYETKLSGVIYSIHHDGYNPRLKRIRGCINVFLVTLIQLREMKSKMENLIQFMERPDHHRYSELFLIEAKSFLKVAGDVKWTLSSIDSECIEMEKDILDNAEKYG